MRKTRITELMRQRGYTQEMIAKELGITKQAVNIAIASANPRLSTLEAIAKVLKVNVYELFVNPNELATDGPSLDLECPHCANHFEAVMPLYVKPTSEQSN